MRLIDADAITKEKLVEFKGLTDEEKEKYFFAEEGGMILGRAKRKPRPSIPRWAWLDRDGCWFCKSRNNCNQCKANRMFAKEFLHNKYKGKKVEE